MNVAITLAFYISIVLLPLLHAQRPGRRQPKRARTQLLGTRILHHPQAATWNLHSADPQELKCRVSGPPTTKLRWEKDGNRISANRRITVNQSQNNEGRLFFGTLLVNTIQKGDEGSYVCVVESEKDSARSRPAVITIYGPPSVNSDVKPLPEVISVGWHESFLLRCDGKGPPAVDKVTWSYKTFSDDEGGDVIFKGTQSKRLDDSSLRTLPREDDAMNRNIVRYEVYCTVYNSVGSETSATTTIRIKRLPERPIINRITPLDKGRVATLFWKVGFAGFDKITGCSANVQGKNLSGTKTSLDIRNKEENVKYLVNLVPLNSYSVRIKCRNSVGSSPWTEERSFTTKEGFPDRAPKNVTVKAVNATSINATWLSIEKDHVFGVLLGYKVKLLRSGKPASKMRTLPPDVLQASFSNVPPGGRYCFYVLGFTKVQDGDWSMPECVTLSALEPPVIKSIKTAPRKVTFEYVDHGNNKGALRNCSIVMQDPRHHKYTVSIKISKDIAEHTIRNLPPNTQYETTIQCFTEAKSRVLSKTSIFRTAEEIPSEAPAGLYFKNEERMVRAFWDRIDTSALNGNFTGYNVCMTATNSKMECDWHVYRAEYTFRNILPKQTYTISVASCTNAGCGPFAYKVVTTSNWSFPSTTSPVPNGTEADGSGYVSEAGRLTPAYIVIALAATTLILSLVVFYFRKHRRKKAAGRNGAAVVFIPSSGDGAQYDQVHARLPASSPSNSHTLNEYESPMSLANRPSLSAETFAKLDGVKICRDRLILGNRLGKGEFGRVYKGKLQPVQPSGNVADDGSVEVAVKTMIMEEFDASEREEFVKEGLRMRDMNHPNVMNLIGICLPEEGNSPSASGSCRMSGYEAISPLVVVPYMANGDLKHYLYTARVNDEAKHLTLNTLLRFAYDITSGMEYLVSRNIVHRDLACRNCMLNADMRVVVSDFGLSRQIYSSSYYRQKRAAKMPVKWMALESLVDRIFTSATDVWAFGVTAWEIFTFCQNPYPGVQNHEMHELLKAGTRLKQPPNCPGNIWNDAIYPSWDPRPEERPTFAELVDLFTGYLKSHPADYDSEASSSPVYVNVQPPEDYKDVLSPSDPLLCGAAVSANESKVTEPYETLVETSPSGKMVRSQGRDRSSSKRPLLGTRHEPGESDEEVDRSVD